MLLSSGRINSIDGLKGKTIAVGAVGGAPPRIARVLLKQFNINPDRKINFLSIGAAQARIGLMKQGLADAAMVPPPFDVEGRKLGFAVLARTYEKLSFPQSRLTIHSRRLKEKPDQIKRVIKAGIKANAYIRGNVSGTIQFLSEWQRASQAIAAATYDSISAAYSIDCSIPVDGLNLVIQDTKELLDVKSEAAVNDVIDTTALRQAQAELGLKPK